MKLVRTFCEAFTITLIGISCGAGAYLWWHKRQEWRRARMEAYRSLLRGLL